MDVFISSPLPTRACYFRVADVPHADQKTGAAGLLIRFYCSLWGGSNLHIGCVTMFAITRVLFIQNYSTDVWGMSEVITDRDTLSLALVIAVSILMALTRWRAPYFSTGPLLEKIPKVTRGKQRGWWRDAVKLVIDVKWKKWFAPSEDRTHDLEIMRLARCLLRYRGDVLNSSNYL